MYRHIADCNTPPLAGASVPLGPAFPAPGRPHCRTLKLLPVYEGKPLSCRCCCLVLQGAQLVVDGMVSSITLTPAKQRRAQSSTRGSPTDVQQAAAASAFAAKLPQLRALQLQGFTAPQLRAWTASPAFSSSTAFSRVTRLQLVADSLSEADAGRLAVLLPSLQEANITCKLPAGLGAALAQHCPHLQSLDLVAAGDGSDSLISSLLRGLSPQLRQLHVRRERWGLRGVARFSDLSGLVSLEALQWQLEWRWAQLCDLPAGLTELRLSLEGDKLLHEAPAGPQLHAACFARLVVLDTSMLLGRQIWTRVLAHMPSLQVAKFRAFERDAFSSPPLPLLSLRELHLRELSVGRYTGVENQLIATPALQQHLHAAAPALQLFFPMVVSVYIYDATPREAAELVCWPLSLLASFPEGARLPHVTLEVTMGYEPAPALDDVLAAIDEPLPAITGLVLLEGHLGLLGSAARLEGLLRVTLPNVRYLRLDDFNIMCAAQMQAVARGLPKLSYVAVVTSDVGAEALHAFACALSEQRSTSTGCSAAGCNCLTLDVVDFTHIGAVAPISKQRVQHPGVEVREVQEWKLPQDV